MSHEAIARPPRVPSWLVGLFTSFDQTESILGDLQEEFIAITSRLGVARARRWYWRQSAKTIAHLIGNQFCISPWLIATTVFGGFVLHGVANKFTADAIVGLFFLHRHHVTPYYTPSELKAHILWMEISLSIGTAVMSLFAGCVVAVAAKEKEVTATTTLGFLITLVEVGIAVSEAKHVNADAFALLRLYHFQAQLFARALLIAIGGIIVRETRAAMSRQPSGA
jgi:hypothetical protein